MVCYNVVVKYTLQLKQETKILWAGSVLNSAHARLKLRWEDDIKMVIGLNESSPEELVQSAAVCGCWILPITSELYTELS
jgi:hypothetical protein